MESLRKRVLIIDDDPDLADLVAEMLSLVVDKVVVAHTADVGLATAKAKPHPDLILCDVGMPIIDGFELRRRLSADDALRDIPFIFMSMENNIDAQLTGLRLGAVDYLTKPITQETLISRVAHHLQLADEAEVTIVDEKEPEEGHSIAGTLDVIPLVDLLQLLEAGRRIGTVTVKANGVDGVVRVSEGKVLNAKAGKYVGEDAMVSLLSQTTGQFQFEALPNETDVIADSSRLDRAVGPLLMDSMWITDELSQDSIKVPSDDDQIIITDRVAALSCFDGNAAWKTMTKATVSNPMPVRQIARLLGIGLFRCRVGLIRGIDNGSIRLL